MARSLNSVLAPAFHLINRNEGAGYVGIRNCWAFRDVQLSMRYGPSRPKGWER